MEQHWNAPVNKAEEEKIINRSMQENEGPGGEFYDLKPIVEESRAIISEEERLKFFEQKINPDQLVTAKAIAKYFGHRWADITSNGEIKEGISLKEINKATDQYEEGMSGNDRSDHPYPSFKISKINDQIILWDESYSKRYEYAVYQDGSYKINISKKDSQGETGGIVVFSISGHEIGEAQVDIGTKNFGLRHILSLRSGLYAAGITELDNINKKSAEAAEWLNESDKKEYVKVISNERFQKYEDEAKTQIEKMGYALIKEKGELATASDLENRVKDIVSTFNTKAMSIYGDKDIDTTLNKFNEVRDNIYSWPLYLAVNGDYNKLLKSLTLNDAFYQDYGRSPHSIFTTETSL